VGGEGVWEEEKHPARVFLPLFFRLAQLAILEEIPVPASPLASSVSESTCCSVRRSTCTALGAQLIRDHSLSRLQQYAHRRPHPG
jgi:hypothetical protein